ncbi:MAG TPA: RNA polymerase sigma factor [Steroidobacter sp.]|uniref:RNA polymerase sigma factor n=1 Tax=Steroidobacter sp. TaxID=1978227 RepID=UPI002EDA11EA
MATNQNDLALPGHGIDFGASSFRDYDKHLHRYLAHRLPRPQDAEDLAQEVYLRLLRIDGEKCVEKPLAYIYGIASHLVADYRSETRREHERLRDDDDEVLEDGWEASTDNLADRLNLQQQLERALAQLPRTQALVLLAHKHRGLSYEEVAAELGLSVHTVEKYITQAKARIRTMTWER